MALTAELSPKRCRRGPKSQMCVCVVGGGGGEDGRLYLTLHCYHLNDFCIKMGSDESHFNVSLTVRGKVTDSVHRPQLLKSKESRSGIEPRFFCLPAKRLTARPNWLSGVCNFVFVDRCYIALFSALEQTHCTRM